MRRDFKEYANKTTVSEEGISKLRNLYVKISCKGERHFYFYYKIDNTIVIISNNMS